MISRRADKLSLDLRILSLARERLAGMRDARESMLDAREREVYEKNPKVRELDGEIRAVFADALGAALSHGKVQEKIDEISVQSLALQQERIYEITAAGFPADYLDPGYMCEKCHDTGYIGREMCSCLTELYKEEQQKSLSDLFKLGDESFESFDLTLYDDRPDPKTGRSARESMALVLAVCRNYADSFGANSKNLLLTGAPGLGKTFLSACIARTVSGNGFSVVYDTAQSIFSKMEDDHFYRGDHDSVRAEIKRIMSCDLLILDDLGTEMISSFIQSALYELINTRLSSGKKTVINTNLSPEDIRIRYSPQIFSRLDGEYRALRFFGNDIRKVRQIRRPNV